MHKSLAAVFPPTNQLTKNNTAQSIEILTPDSVNNEKPPGRRPATVVVVKHVIRINSVATVKLALHSGAQVIFAYLPDDQGGWFVAKATDQIKGFELRESYKTVPGGFHIQHTGLAEKLLESLTPRPDRIRFLLADKPEQVQGHTLYRLKFDKVE